MAKFCFYSKNSPGQESIGTIDVSSREEAIKFFSSVKQLSVQDFLTIFEVKAYGFKEGITENTKQLLKG